MSRETAARTGEPTDDVVEVEDPDSFEATLEANGTVLADYYADWCGPCKQQEPILESVAESVDAPVVSVDVDAHPGLAEAADVRSIPTVIVYRDGDPADRFVGLTDAETLRDAVA